MSIKIKKSIILVFLVLLMFFVIPMSFAIDVGDDDGPIDVVSVGDETEDILNVENDVGNSNNGNMLGVDEYNGIIYVSKLGNDSNNGSLSSPVLTIAKAIELATSESNVYHMIIIGNGTYEENSLSVSSDLVILGNNVVIDALGENNNILVISGGKVWVSGITFANVGADAETLSDCHAISIENANVVIDSCVFENNSAFFGPAIDISDAGGNNTVVISNNLFRKQSARFTGVIFSANSKIDLSNNTMVDCTSVLGNPGIYMSGGEILSEVNLEVFFDDVIRLGQNVTLYATLTDDNGNSITGGYITFIANDEEISEITIDNDYVSTVFVPEEVGQYVISGNYSLAKDVYVETALIVVDEPYTGIIYVSKDGDDYNIGSEDEPVLTIAKAIELATSENNTMHMIFIDNGTYEENSLSVSSDLMIIGNNTVIDALGESNSILLISGGNVWVSGITFANVDTDWLTLTDHHAVSIENASAVIDNCVFENNTAYFSPAIDISNAGENNTVVISNNIFRKQSARFTGVIFSDNSTICLLNNTMVDCTSILGNPGIYISGGEILSEVHLEVLYNDVIRLGQNVTVYCVLYDDNWNFITGGNVTLTANGEIIDELPLDDYASAVFVPEKVGLYVISGNYSLARDVDVSPAFIVVEERYTGVIYVSKDGDDYNIGSEDEPVLTISKAIELATSEYNVEHMIIIDNGTYEENSLSVSSDLMIIGNNTVIDALGESKNILNINGGNVWVSGITFANVDTDWLTLTDHHAVSIENASAVIDNCVFENNTAYFSPAIDISNAGENNTVVISNNIFKEQSVRFNGIIYSYNSTIYLSNNTMIDCTSFLGNSGIFVSGGEILSEVNLRIYPGGIIRLGQNVTLYAELFDNDGNSIYGGTINLTANGETIDELGVYGDVSTVFVPEESDLYVISGNYSLSSNVNVYPTIVIVVERYTGIIYVSKDGDDDNSGSERKPVLTIAKAIELATSEHNTEHMIIIDNGTYEEEDLVIDSNLTIIGNNTIINSRDNILNIEGGNVYISGITFANVFEPIDFGTIKIQNANVVIDNCIFENNTALRAPAIYVSDVCDDNVVAITNNRFINQNALLRGIIYASDSNIYLENNTMEDCKSYILGSDIYIDGGEILSEVNLIIKRNKTVPIGHNTTLTVRLADDNGNSIVGGKLYLTANDEIFDVVDISRYYVPVEFWTGMTVANYTISGIYDSASNVNVQTAFIEVIDGIIVNAKDVTKYFGGPESFVVTVTDFASQPLANKMVEITINGRTYNRITDENGTASLSLNLNSNVYNVTSTVENKTVESVVTILSTVEGNDIVKVFKNNTQYTATFKDTNGNYLAKGTEIQFNINGILYKRTVDKKGVAQLDINLPQGNYIITAINTVTGEMHANNVTVLPRIVENNDITKYFKNGTQYTVKLIGDDGNLVGAGEEVTFNINGIFYKRTTDENGVAQLDINLPPGEYIITADYKGCKVSNKITVKPVLFAEDLTKKYGTPDQFIASLLDGQGKPYEGQNVTFNINGVLYNRATDSNGEAKLDINLLAGEYIITSSFNGANVANKVTVTA